ncbi:MAG: holo-ACP synthase [Deltaproteobacteria bacterium]
MHNGIDIVCLFRFKEAAGKAAFLKRVFTDTEIGDSMAARSPFKRLAGGFAAKEACLKALGTGFGGEIGLKDIEVTYGGASPALKLHREAKRLLGDRRVFLSLAYSKELAVAAVLME